MSKKTYATYDRQRYRVSNLSCRVGSQRSAGQLLLLVQSWDLMFENAKVKQKKKKLAT